MDQQKKINFDPTINLGHIISVGVMLLTVMSAYYALNSRVAVLEDRAVQIEIKLRENNASVKDSLKEIKEDVKDMRQAVENVSGAIIKKMLK